MLDFEALNAALTALTARHSALSCSVLTHSILGRDIPLITLGHGKRGVLYVGAHRGTDGITSGILLDFITDYLRQYERGATVFEYPMPYLFEERKIYVVPMLNPDGVDYVANGVGEDNPLFERAMRMNGSEDFSHWQANARGVDLHHNYDAGFTEHQKSRGLSNGAPSLFGGEFPESEPETAALARFLRLRREEIMGVLSLRAPGEALVCNCNDNLSAKTMAVGRVLSRMTGYRLERPEGVSAYGSLSDWCIEKLGRPAFTVDCGRGESPLPEEQRPLIYERLRRVLFSFPCLV
ncbi:MAG: hypothetical protein IJY22_08880 [Clostridia bacterium]|nr:hypothetical protein [Clostridia bacterium]